MSWLSSFLHPERAYKASQDQLDKYYQQSQGALNPYNQNGQDAYKQYSGAMNNLMNPAALQDEWSKNYQESDLAKQNEAMASQHGLNAASSMGLMGSQPALSAIQSGTAGIVAQDRQQYLDDLMKKYMAGVGIGQDIYGKGAGAAGQMSQNSMTMGENSAQNQFNQTNAPGQMFGNLLGAGAGFLAGPAQGWLSNKMGVQQNQGWSPMGNYSQMPWYSGGK